MKRTIFDVLGREPIHPFPARMAPGVAFDAIHAAKTQLTVLDPMAGSGTVLAVARANGHKAIGVDIDPLAVLLSRVWTRAVDPEEVARDAEGVFQRATRAFRTVTAATSFPTGADKDTKAFIAYWFDASARKELTSLCRAIDSVENTNSRDLLWSAFSRLIICKQAGASRALDLSHSRPHRYYERAPISPMKAFLPAVSRVLSNCISKSDRV